MTRLLRIEGDPAMANLVKVTSMSAEGLNEPQHLEKWIIAHPEIIEDGLKIVATQFNRWVAGAATASERLDVLALATSGELVVIELKQRGDRNVHLQAITYGALVAGFTAETLFAAHAAWLGKQEARMITSEEAEKALRDHVEGEWSDDLSKTPRLLLVAEEFPAQVLTTVQWLRDVAPNLDIECHEYRIFNDNGLRFVSFDRIYPVDDLSDFQLLPGTATARDATTTGRRRGPRMPASAQIVHEHQAIPQGSPVSLVLQSQVKPDVIAIVQGWLDQDPLRADIAWVDDPKQPLLWAVEPDRTWTLSALRNEIFNRAGLPPTSSSAADGWYVGGRSIKAIADIAFEAALSEETI